MQLGDTVGSTGNDLIDGIGGAILGSVGDAAIDALITPDGMVTIITTGAVATSLLPPEMRNRELTWTVEYEGLSRFRGVSTFDDGSPGPVLVFERRGLGWQVVAMANFAIGRGRKGPRHPRVAGPRGRGYRPICQSSGSHRVKRRIAQKRLTHECEES